MSGMPSGVNEKTPLMPSASDAAPRSAGMARRAHAHDSAKSSGVNASTDGMTGASLGASSVRRVDRHRPMAVRADPRRSTCSRA